MTDIRKSDAQLDAEASQPLEERDLTQAVALHRRMYRKDNGLPPQLNQEDGDDSGVGAAFNPMFVAYLDGEGWQTDSWNSALLWTREKVCRVVHAKHWDPPEWQGSLCYRLTSHVIRLEMPLDEAMSKLGLTEDALTERTLNSALLTIENRLAWMLRGDMPEVKREPIEWMASAHVHRRLEGLHLEDCAQCRRGLDDVA